MSQNKYIFRAAITLLLIKEDKILLIRRSNTGWEDGKYSLVGGHIEDNETVAETAVREAKEEIGIVLEQKNLKVVYIMHDSKSNYIGFFLLATHWKGNPVIKEKNKFDDIQWFPLDNLPTNMPSQNIQGINGYLHKEQFSEFKLP